jgi:hypothetical protein
MGKTGNENEFYPHFWVILTMNFATAMGKIYNKKSILPNIMELK